jgi:GntR family transcriptional regulator of vanillate catabolism
LIRAHADDCVSDLDIERMRMSKSSEINETDPTAGRDGDDAATNPTRAAWIVEHLRQALLDGRYPFGSRMNEVHLSQDLGVSRTPLRTAMQILAGEGLLQYRPNRGFTVREFSVSDIVGAFEMRALAEGLAARLAAEKGLSEALRAKLERALAEGDAALAGTAEPEAQRAAYARINEIFHSAVHEAAGSSLVEDVVRLCQRMPQASAHNVMAFDLDDVRERHRAHHAIYDAILGREPAEAENLMRRHVLWVKKSMVRAFARHARD